jgi:hypothetical protein
MNNREKAESGALDVRGLQYSLEYDAAPAHLGKPATFCTCAITEHQSVPALSAGDPTEFNTGLFQDEIGPHGSTQGSVHSKRFFTVVLDGTNLGSVQINDRYGYHPLDDIKINSSADTTELNGHLDPTDIQ